MKSINVKFRFNNQVIETEDEVPTNLSELTDDLNIAQMASDISDLDLRTEGIENLIPATASISNKLADVNFVNSSVSTNTAYFIGTFETVNDLKLHSGSVTNNDYAFVMNSERDFNSVAEMNAYNKDLLTNYDYAWIPNSTKYDLYRFDIMTQLWDLRETDIEKTDVSLVTAYNRYKYNGLLSEWSWEYTTNNSGFTAAQWAAINSGITSDLVTTFSGKQDALVSGSNIKTINNQSVLGAGNIAITTHNAFPNSWPTTGTTAAFCAAVDADPNAFKGMSFLGRLHCSDFNSSGINISNGDAIVEIMDGSGTSGKVIRIVLTSGATYPYRWEYAYWNGGSQVSGWIAFQPKMSAGANISISSNGTISATDTTYSSLSAAQGGTAVSLVTTGEKYIWNNKVDSLYGTVTVASSSWTALTGNANFSYYANIKLNSSLALGASDSIEIVNNDPDLFLDYGFAIGGLTNNVLTLYATNSPTTNVKLMFIITRNMKLTTLEASV